MKLLLGKNGATNVHFDAQDLVTGRTCVIAQSGAGKSYLIAVMCEKLLAAGVGFCLVDTEGEYASLKDKFDLLLIGPGSSADENIHEIDFPSLSERLIAGNIPAILDVSESEERHLVAGMAAGFFEAASRLRVPYLLILEEADKFVPQGRDSVREIEEISKRGRKRGLGLLVATQRPAIISKNVLSQCGTQFIGKLTTENDLAAVNLFFDSRSEAEELCEFEPGFFFVIHKGRKTRFRSVARETSHQSVTPGLRFGRVKATEVGSLGSRRQAAEKSSVITLREAAVTAKPAAAPVLRTPIPGPRPDLPLGLIPTLDRDEALRVAGGLRKKKFVLFGDDEKLQSVELEYRPLVHIRTRGTYGIFRRLRNHSFILDGLTDRLAEIDGGIRFRHGFSGLLGLSEGELRVLRALDDIKTVADLEVDTGIADGRIRNILRVLGKKNLTTAAGKAGRATQYVRLLDFEVGNLEVDSAVPALVPVAAAPARRGVQEEEVRAVLKAWNPTAEIVAFTPFFYPLYRIRFETRTVCLDAVTGNAVKESP